MPKNIAIIYASTTGNTEAVADKISALLTDAKLENKTSRAEETDHSFITENSTFVFATSTWDHGKINPLFDELLDYISKNDMSGKKAAFVGLGDKSYEPEAFNTGIKILKEAFVKAGGTEIGTTLLIDGDPFPLLDTKVPFWTQKLIPLLENEK